MKTETNIERDEFRNIWVLGEVTGNRLAEVTSELLGVARELAAARKCEVWAVLLGSRLHELADVCVQQQADTVLLVEDAALERFVDSTYANTLIRLVRKYKPEVVLGGATARGRSLLPRVAVQLETGLTADCTELSVDPETGELLQTRPAFGGNIMATIKTPAHRPQMATVRPHVFTPAEPDSSRRGRIIAEALDARDIDRGMRVIESVRDQPGTTSLAGAKVIIAGGRGVAGKGGFDLLRRLAASVGGAVGASRAAVDAGWIDYAHQIGQTGQTVQPRVYIACGVSGQIQHLVGMQSADVVIAINTDREAPIMTLADYALVGDLNETIPAIMAELQKT